MVKTVKQKRNKSKVRKTRSKKNGGGQSGSRASLLNNDFAPTSMLDDFVLENKEKLEGFTNEQIIRIFIMSLEHHSTTLLSVSRMYRKILLELGILENVNEDIKMPVPEEIEKIVIDKPTIFEDTVVPETFNQEEDNFQVVVQDINTPERKKIITPPVTPKEYSNTPNRLEIGDGNIKDIKHKGVPIKFPPMNEL